MSANENEIVWTDSSWRVVRASHGALYVERERLDAMRVKTWVHADVDEQMGALSRCVSALHDRVKKAEAGLERFREVVEAKLPEYAPSSSDTTSSLSRPHTHAYSRIERELMPNEHEDPRVAEERRLVGLESHLASLRAELTALGKHVEDVERRAYDTPTKAEHVAALRAGAELAKKVASLDPLFSEARTAFDRVADVLDDGTAAAARVEFRKRLTDIEETTAGKAETLEAVRSLTDALQALRQEMTTSWKTAVTQNELTDALTELNAKVDDLAAGWGSCGPARPDEKREAVIREHEAGYREAPLDLATLRVPGQATGVSETAVSFRPAGHALDIVTEVRVLPGYGSEERHEWVTVGPSEARLLARALTQWADEKEAKPGPSPRAYEPDSEDGA